jgi:arylsulfatase A-like enzyme
MTPRTRSLLALVGIVLLAGCARNPGAGRRPNIVVVVIDTLRADRVGAYGNRRGLTPFLDSLAARGAVFEHAYAQSGWTNPSVASLLTSRFQSQHGFIAFDSVLADEEVTLPEVLKAHGYRTAAFSGNGLIPARAGFAQGYDVYKTHWVRRVTGPDGQPRWRSERDDVLNDEAFAWIDAERAREPAAPLFLYLQYMAPHTPYDPPADVLARRFAGAPAPDLDAVHKLYFQGVTEPLTADELKLVTDVYDAAVEGGDACLRELFAGLAKRGFLDHAVVVVTADHGEEFKDHGFMGHGGTLYEEIIHVPLVVLAGSSAHVDVGDVVSLIDVAPTLLDFAGVPAPASFEGRSLRPLLARAAPGVAGAVRRLVTRAEPRPAYSELIVPEKKIASRLVPHERAVVLGRTKAIVGFHGERELYDLDADPAEKASREHLDAATDARLEVALAAARARAAHGPTSRAVAAPDADDEERLRALGYVR